MGRSSRINATALVYVSTGERTAPELAGPPGAFAERAGWEAFWLTTAIVAAVGAAIAARTPVLRPGSVSALE